MLDLLETPQTNLPEEHAVSRLFMVWNRSYRCHCVIASSMHHALDILTKNGHLRRASAYRRAIEATAGDVEHDQESMATMLEQASANGSHGVVKHTVGQGWLFS